MTSYAIGIDLGTTHSCVGVYQFDKVEIIANDHGSRTTPSCVAFTEETVFVGEPAMDIALHDPESTVYDMKRLIGRRYADKSVQSDIKTWPFNVVSDDGFPKVAINTNGTERTFKPEDISAMVLRKMKSTAEAFLESSVDKAVITVPAYFTDYQREATLEAAKMAGLDVLRIVNEPTAAALAYTVIKEDMTGTILVYDIGGGTLDISIVSITEPHRIVVKGTHGNTHLGGEDFSNNILEHMIKICKKKYKKDIRNNKRAIARLRHHCESAKKKLSFADNVTIFVDCLIDGIDFKETLTRPKFNELNLDGFKSTLEHVNEALKSTQIDKNDIDKIIMVGGSSKIPKLKTLLQQFFNTKEVHNSINADEAIAYGASIYAAIYNGVDIQNRSNLIIQDITPMSLGIETVDYETFSVVIKKYTSIPSSAVKVYTTAVDNQTNMKISVYEGEAVNAKENNFLGTFTIYGIPPRPKGQEECNVTFSINNNGVLKVSAINLSTGIEDSIIIDRKF